MDMYAINIYAEYAKRPGRREYRVTRGGLVNAAMGDFVGLLKEFRGRGVFVIEIDSASLESNAMFCLVQEANLISFYKHFVSSRPCMMSPSCCHMRSENNAHEGASYYRGRSRDSLLRRGHLTWTHDLYRPECDVNLPDGQTIDTYAVFNSINEDLVNMIMKSKWDADFDMAAYTRLASVRSAVALKSARYIEELSRCKSFTVEGVQQQSAVPYTLHIPKGVFTATTGTGITVAASYAIRHDLNPFEGVFNEEE